MTLTRPSAVPVRLEPREDLDLAEDVVPDVLVADALFELGARFNRKKLSLK